MKHTHFKISIHCFSFFLKKVLRLLLILGKSFSNSIAVKKNINVCHHFNKLLSIEVKKLTIFFTKIWNFDLVK